MAFDEVLAQQVEDYCRTLAPSSLEKKKMFGGVGFLISGNMACGVIQNKLIIRIGKDAYLDALEQPLTAPFDLTGRPMTGWVYVDNSVVENVNNFHSWIKKGIDFALTLPKK